MDKKELVAYTQRYMADERQEIAELAWGVYGDGDRGRVESLIKGFYKEAEASAEEDWRAFDIKTIAEDHDVAIVTAIRTYGNLGPFRPQNRDDFKGVRLFDILLRPDQIACCSTAAVGDSKANLYGNWGVILSEGKIHQAFPYDATTSVRKGEVHSKFAPRISDIRPTEQMHQALKARHLYNEINASIGGIAGIFYCVDGDDERSHDFPSKPFRDLIAPFNIPQYLLRQGEFYRITELEDIENGRIGEAVRPSEIVQTSVQSTQEQREEMIDYLTDNLTLAPRNSITSGVARGQFAYEYIPITPRGRAERFFREQERLLRTENESLRLYGAMALYAFAEAADQKADYPVSERARKLAESALSFAAYEEYRRRILPSGNLAITPDDLCHYLNTEELPSHLQDH